MPLSDDDLALLKEPEQMEKNDARNDPNIQDRGSLPYEYALYQCYPNPFNPTTTIRYALPVTSKVILKVFNSLGVEVKTLVDKEEATGHHASLFDGSTSSSGIYIYRLNVENIATGEKKIFEKKMSLLK